MEISRVSDGLPADPDNIGWVLGWAVYRMSPWSLFAVSLTKDKADQFLKYAGKDYSVSFGSHRLGSDDFILIS
jgi:hypothetical protein